MKRSSYLQYKGTIALEVKPLKVWAYGRTGRFACRVEINGAGMSVYAGRKGGKKLIDSSWENLVKKLSAIN